MNNRWLLTFQFGFTKVGFGGGHVILLNLARQLRKNNNEVLILCFGKDELNIAEEYRDLSFIFLNGNKFFFSFKVLRVLREYNPQIVFSFTAELLFFGLYNAFFKSYKLITYFAAPNLPVWRIRAVRYNPFLFSQYLGSYFCDKIFFISDHLMREAQLNWRGNQNKYFVLGCGISDVFLENIQTFKCQKKEFIRLLYFGRIDFDHKPLDLILPQLPKNSILSIIGTGRSERELFKLLEELNNPNIKYLGQKSSSEIIKIIDSTDIVVLPSKFESFFIAFHEALSRNRVIVVSDVAGLKENYFNYPGIFFPSELSSHSINVAIDASVKYLSESNDVIDRDCKHLTWGNITLKLINGASNI
jgi:glycosyltransferase involved in cell wall biosynthesis